MSELTVFDERVLHRLLGDLPAGRLRGLAVRGRTVVRPAGYRLSRQDGPAENFWLLRSGAVTLDLCLPGRGDVVVGRVGADGVGCSWLVPPYRSAVAVLRPASGELLADPDGHNDVRGAT
jgi:hypothetical protein